MERVTEKYIQQNIQKDIIHHMIKILIQMDIQVVTNQLEDLVL